MSYPNSPFETGGPGSAPPPPEPQNASAAPSMTDIESLISQRLNEAEERHKKALQDQRERYEAQIKATARNGIQDSYVPHHAGGPGGEVTETWCAAYQDMAYAGELPDLVLAHARGEAPPDTGDGK